MSKVSFIKSDDRKYNIERCLSLLKSEIVSGVKDAKNIVIKPNCVSDKVKLASTNKEAIDAVLEFIKPYTNAQITLAEGSGIGNTIDAFKNFGYLELQEKYDFTIVDLNSDEFETVPLLLKNGKTWQAQVAKTIINSDYLISVSPPKTHNEVVYSGAIKNVSVGALLRRISTFSKYINQFNESIGLPKNSKALIHQGPKITNENIKRIYSKIPLKLAVLDGYEAMQGDGPIDGDMVPAHWAIASTDPLAAEFLACQLMGIDIDDVGYLSLLNTNEDAEDFIVGDDWKKNIIKFKMHSNFEEIKQWNSPKNTP